MVTRFYPATHQAQVANRQAVGAGLLGEEQGDECGGAVAAAAERVKRIGNRQGRDAPFFGAGVITMQVQPQACRQFLTRALVLDDRHAGVVNTAVQDQCESFGTRLRVAVIVALELRTVRIGAGCLQPRGDDLTENAFLPSP